MEEPPSTPALTRILLVDDHVVVRAGLRMLLETRSHLQVVGEAAGREDALRQAAQQRPDIILLDLDLGKENSLDFLQELMEACPCGKVIVMTGLRDPMVHEKAVALGAVGLVTKDKAAETLLKAVDRVCRGDVWVDRAMLAKLVSRRTAKPDPESLKIQQLTVREREIITLVAEGLKNQQIAGRLFISEATVRHHLTSIFSKLEVGDRLELLIFALRHGLAQPPRPQS